MAYPLIGLSGRKRSGKDSFAAHLVAEHGYTRLAFADALRDAALALDPFVSFGVESNGYEYGYNGEWYPSHEPYATRLSEYVSTGGWDEAKELPEVRRTLQRFGVGIREVMPDFWLRVVADRSTQIPGPVVVTDVRFPNEAEWVEAAGGDLVRIERPGIDTSDTHESETALDDRPATFTVVNDADLARLYAEADRIHRLVS